MIAEVIINSNARALNRIFDYDVPTEMEKDIKVGSRVFVPFGKGSKLDDGFVIGFKDASEYECKPIGRIEIQNSLSKENIELAKLMAEKYFCNISDCIKLMLPPGTSSKDVESRMKAKTGNFVYLAKSAEKIEENIENKQIKSEKHIRLLRMLEQNDGIYTTDLEVLADVSHSIIKTVEKNGWIKIEEEQIIRDPLQDKKIEKDNKLKLNEEQQAVYNQVEFMLENEEFCEFLLKGITGSRKDGSISSNYRKSFNFR